MISVFEQSFYSAYVFAAMIGFCVLGFLVTGLAALPFMLVIFGVYAFIRFFMIGSVLRSSDIREEQQAVPILPNMILHEMGQNERIQYALSASRISDSTSLIFVLSGLPFCVWFGFFQPDFYESVLIKDLWLKIQTALGPEQSEMYLSDLRFTRSVEIYAFYMLCGLVCVTSRAFIFGIMDRRVLLSVSVAMFLLSLALHLLSGDFARIEIDFYAQSLSYWRGHGFGFYNAWKDLVGPALADLSPYQIRLMDLGMTGVILSYLPFVVLGLIFLRNASKELGKGLSDMNMYRFSMCFAALVVLIVLYSLDRFFTASSFIMGLMMSVFAVLGVFWALSVSQGQRQMVFIQR